jgi:galactokinase
MKPDLIISLSLIPRRRRGRRRTGGGGGGCCEHFRSLRSLFNDKQNLI